MNSSTIVKELMDSKSEKDLYDHLIKHFPSETALLCGKRVQVAPSTSFKLDKGYTVSQLPSAISSEVLLVNKNCYDRKDFIEFERGFGAADNLHMILEGGKDNYKKFISGQPDYVALTEEQFNAMHEDYNKRLHNDDLKLAAFYMAAFNDVGKSEIILEAASEITGEKILDHDKANAIIVSNEEARKKFYPELALLNKNVQALICAAVGLDFNPMCFMQGESPLYPVAQVSEAISKVPEAQREDVFSLIKIEAATDLTAARKHQAKGGATYNRYVHLGFEDGFRKLHGLIENKSPEEKSSEGQSPEKVYLSFINEHAQKVGLDVIQEQDIRITLTRIALMIRATDKELGKLVLDVFNELKKNAPDLAEILIKELAINNLKYGEFKSLWMQYSPDALRIPTRENKLKTPTPAEGLMLGLKIYANVLKLAREQVWTMNTACYMVQGRDLIPTIKDAVSQDNNKEAWDILYRAAQGELTIVEGHARYKIPSKVQTLKTVGSFPVSNDDSKKSKESQQPITTNNPTLN